MCTREWSIPGVSVPWPGFDHEAIVCGDLPSRLTLPVSLSNLSAVLYTLVDRFLV